MRWLQTTMGEVCLPTVQKDPSRNGAGSFRYIDISGIDREQKSISRFDPIPCESAPSRARKLVQAGDVLVSTVRPNLNAVALVPEELDGEIASTGFSVLRANPKLVNPRYLFYRVQHQEFVACLVANATGASYPAVTDGVVRRAPLPLPSLNEQARIVEILDEADQLRRLRREADAKAARILPALFLKMFGDPATNPMGWPIISIGDLTTLVTSGATPRGGAEVYVNEGPYLIRSQNVLMNRIDLSDAARITNETHQQMSRTWVSIGDVLLNITGASIGRVAWVRLLDTQANINQHVCLIRPNKNLVNPAYLSRCLSLPFLQSTINSVQIGASRQALNHVQVRNLRIPKPPITLQSEFARQAIQIEDLLEQADSTGIKLDALWETLLQHAFSGQLSAKWREAHSKELLAEMEQQARLLNLPLPKELEATP